MSKIITRSHAKAIYWTGKNWSERITSAKRFDDITADNVYTWLRSCEVGVNRPITCKEVHNV